MPSELHSTSSPIPASDLDPSNDLDDQKNRPRKMVQLDSLDNVQVPTSQHKRPHQTPLGSNDTGNEFNQEDYIYINAFTAP
ncbi:hypothetical protein BDR22DRAFT_238251 [Usnea florida]